MYWKNVSLMIMIVEMARWSLRKMSVFSAVAEHVDVVVVARSLLSETRSNYGKLIWWLKCWEEKNVVGKGFANLDAVHS